MDMIIPEFGTLQLTRSNEQHFGQSKIQPVAGNYSSVKAVSSVSAPNSLHGSSAVSSVNGNTSGKSFQSYLIDAMSAVNDQQMDVTKLQEKVITSPDEVDIHDVTIAMSKARMSLNLAQSVIDRMVTAWNEITTTR